MKAEDNMTVTWRREWSSKWELVCKMLKNSGLNLSEIILVPQEVAKK